MPVHKGLLKEADYTKIQMNFISLKRELDGKYLLDEMFAANVFTWDDKLEIQSEHSREKRTDMFLEKLLDSGPGEAYGAFLRALQIHYPHLHETLTVKVNVSGEGGDFSKDTPVDETPERRNKQAITDHMSPIPVSEERWRDCKKNPGHNNFIPVKKFDKEHLPNYFQLPEVVEYVKVLGAQTVLTINTLISSERPEGYYYSDQKGKDVTLCATGRVLRVMKKFSQSDDHTCPCDGCKKSPSAAKQWGQFIVVTAKHIVFNNEECANTKFMLWYDEEKPNQSYPVLVGVSIISSDIVYKYSEVLCVTHDKNVSEDLEKICLKNEESGTKLARTCYKREPNRKLAIVISHPHLASKRVSVGELVGGDIGVLGGPSRNVFTTPTCAGSAGAPVLLIDDRMACCTTDDTGSAMGSRLSVSGGKLWPL